MEQLFFQKKDCCGCGACVQICPKHAISMCIDTEGFAYPQIDASRCVGCNLCKTACAFQSALPADRSDEQRVFAVKHIDENVRMQSSSGGVFTALANSVITKGGVVYGAAFDAQFRVVHRRADHQQDCAAFRGSKYVQSDLNDVFLQVQLDLKKGRQVLFTGTPCQCAGLRQYLSLTHCDCENLVLCDLVCHGVPSPMLWEEHIKRLEKKGKIEQYHCRSKEHGWHTATEKVLYSNGKSDARSPRSQEHMSLFLLNNMLRPSCYHCKYTTFDRQGDLTIGDFWGIEKSMPEFDDNKGVSLVLVNTDKGMGWFEKIQTQLTVRQSNQQDCLQPHLEHPAKCPPARDQFWQIYQTRGYLGVVKKYAGVGFVAMLKRIVKKILKGMRLR